MALMGLFILGGPASTSWASAPQAAELPPGPAYVVTMTGYNAILVIANDSAAYGGPTTAHYTNISSGSAALIAQLMGFAAAGILSVIAQCTANGDAIGLFANGAGSGGELRTVNAANTDFTAMALSFLSLTLNYRTGVGTKAIAATIDTAGQVNLAKRLFAAQDTGAQQTAAGLFAGTGAPNNANGSNGDFYLRGDGTTAAHTVLYHKESGSWVATAA